MAETIKFGTDGWRGMIAREFTFDNVRRCAQGLATYLLENGGENQSVVVGFDKRFHSENFGAAAAEVLAGNGLTVYLTAGATPTPVISHAVKAKGAAGAVNITASHNPPIDNGFKVRDEHGGAIPPDDLLKIEKAIPADMNGVKSLDIDKGLKSKKIVTFEPAEDYIRHIKTLIDFQPLMDAGLNIVVDSMWGNGAGWFTNLIGGGKTKIVEFHDVRNPIYPEMDRPEPIPPNVDAGLSKLLEEKGDALVILDGDADRVGIGDEKGEFVNQLRVYGLLAYYLLEVKGERGPIVKTLSTTTMLNKLGKIYDVPVYETGVGFKYVAPKMLEVDAMIGGEESGGYAFRGNVPDRDGILGGLYFLDMMVRLGKKPAELLELLFEKVGAHYYDRIDTIFKGDRGEREKMIVAADPTTIGGLKVMGLNTMDGYKFDLEDGGWMLIRFSGTEPKIRVYCETTHGDRVQSILQDGLNIAGIS